MEKSKYTGTTEDSLKSKYFTELVLEVFRLNGQLLVEGDRLTADFGLTSARWQVMGAIGDDAIPVVQIANKMGLRRQSVQRIVDVLEQESIVLFKENPHHQRAKLVELTELGRQKLNQVEQVQSQWANRLSQNLDADQLKEVLGFLRAIRTNL